MSLSVFQAWLTFVCCALFFTQIMKERDVTALFIGNGKNININVKEIENAVIKTIDMGIHIFLNGGQGQFDRMSACVIHNLKKQYPNIKSYLVIPYMTFKDYDPELYDEIIYPFEKHVESYYTYMGNIGKRNKWMVNRASVAICYVRSTTGGAGKTLEYAKRKGLRIIDLNGGE